MLNMEQHEKTPVVILHGLSNEQIFAVARSVKQTLGHAMDVAFATTTAHSLQMRLQDVITDVTQEHAYMKQHPPGESNA